MVLVQKWLFFEILFLANIGHEHVFYDILERRNAFKGYKNKKFKKSKNRHFSKGVNPWFWSKNGHFYNFFLQAIKARKKSFTIFQNKRNAFPGYTNKKFKKSKTSKRVNPWVWSKNDHFSNFFFFQAIQASKMSFTNILEQKNAVLGYKNKRFKKSKTLHFSKRVTHGFGPKRAIFPTFFFLRQYNPEKSLVRYFRTNKRLSRLQKQEVQKVEKLTFLQRG